MYQRPYNEAVFGFELQAVCPATGARAGILHTAHGDVETSIASGSPREFAFIGVHPRPKSPHSTSRWNDGFDVHRVVLVPICLEDDHFERTEVPQPRPRTLQFHLIEHRASLEELHAVENLLTRAVLQTLKFV